MTNVRLKVIMVGYSILTKQTYYSVHTQKGTKSPRMDYKSIKIQHY